jgi:hypothetical protein
MANLTTCGGCGAPIDDATDDDPSKMLPCATCGSRTRDLTIVAEPIHINLSPFAFQWYAKDFFEAYRAYKQKGQEGETGFSPARLTLLAQAIELAAKSLHVHQGKRDADLRKIGHDLVKACGPPILAVYGITLTEDEATELKKMSALHEAKAFEYFWFDWPGYTPELAGVMHALAGQKDLPLPDESVMEELLTKFLAPIM